VDYYYFLFEPVFSSTKSTCSTQIKEFCSFRQIKRQTFILLKVKNAKIKATTKPSQRHKEFVRLFDFYEVKQKLLEILN
jgi:hypothetical protein